MKRTQRRIDVFYKCTDCGIQRKGGPGKMFCDECGGALRSIGYAGKRADIPDPYGTKPRRG